MPLLKNAKNELFCREYRQSRNGAKAAAAVGYSAKTAAQQASRLLADVNIQARLAELEAEASANMGIDREIFDAHLNAIGLQNIDHFMTFTSDGDPILDVSNATPMQRAAISKIRVDDYLDGRGEDARDVRRIEITMHPKLPALIKIGEAKGWLKEPTSGVEETVKEVAKWVREIRSLDAPFSDIATDDEAGG